MAMMPRVIEFLKEQPVYQCLHQPSGRTTKLQRDLPALAVKALRNVTAPKQ